MKRVVEICCKAAVGAVALLMTGCCPCRNMVAERVTQDSTRTEYRERIVLVPDTVFLQIPLQSAERTTADSVSHLENEFAVSDARITAEGLLFHSLQTKPQTKPIATEREVITRDSVIYKDRCINATKTVQAERALTAFQRIQICGFWLLSVIMATICFLYIKARRNA